MSEEHSKAERLKQAGQAAREEVLHKSVFDALRSATPDDLVYATQETEIIRGRAKRSGGWIHSPGKLDLFRAADKRLTRAAQWAGMPIKQVQKVHAAILKGTKLLILRPAPVEDLTAYPVGRYGSNTIINLTLLLSEASLTVPTGWRERYDAPYIPRESPLWPGLVIDLGDPKERRQDAGRKAEAQAQAQAAAAKQG